MIEVVKIDNYGFVNCIILKTTTLSYNNHEDGNFKKIHSN